MVDYLEKARFPYLDAGRRKDTSDLVLDGWSPPEVLRDKVLEAVVWCRISDFVER